MPKTSDCEIPYFQHDFFAYEDKKIKKLTAKWGDEGYGLFWRIVEFLHREELQIGEEYLIAGGEKEEKVKSILKDFGLFRIDNGYYVSDRIIRNIELIEEKKAAKKDAAQTRWIISAYCKQYKEIFGDELTLSQREKSKIIELSKSIPDLKDKFANIFYTAKCLPKFDKGVVANSSWLLSKDNLLDVLNGKYGTLKSKPTPKIKQEEFVDELDSIGTKTEAIDYIRKNNLSSRNPVCKKLLREFELDESEVFYDEKSA